MENDKKGDIHWVISMTVSCFYRQKTTLSRGKFLGVLLTQIVCQWNRPPERQDIRELALNIRNPTDCQIFTVEVGKALLSWQEMRVGVTVSSSLGSEEGVMIRLSHLVLPKDGN